MSIEKIINEYKKQGEDKPIMCVGLHAVDMLCILKHELPETSIIIGETYTLQYYNIDTDYNNIKNDIRDYLSMVVDDYKSKGML